MQDGPSDRSARDRGPTRSDASSGDEGSSPEPIRRLGDFELLREIGRGGMGVVYEARQISLKRRVALKVLPPAMGLTQQARQRFEREAQAAAKLHHTNIVPVHAIGEEDGHYFYAMDLIEGQSLDQVLRELVDEGSNPLLAESVTLAASELSRMPSPTSQPETTTSGEQTTSLGDTSAGSRVWFDTVARLIAEVADGLHYAHGRGVIHRDIKPGNLMLSTEGRLCITDFGLARVAQEPGMTVSGSFLGTPAYMSPEQIAAGRAKLDHRTDVYSLGAVLYELLTLQRPFSAESREEVLTAIMTKDPRAPRKFNAKIPLDLETICLKTLEKDPDKRYATAGELASDLRQYLQRGLITARRAGPLQRARKSIRRHPTIATAAALGVVFAAIVLAIVTINARRSARAELERLVADGESAWAEGEYDASLAGAQAALAMDANHPQARLLEARSYSRLYMTRKAVEEARGRLKDDPGDWVAHLVLVHAATNEIDQDVTIDAAKHVRAMEEIAPEIADYRYYRALVADLPEEKLEQLDGALELEPDHPEALRLRIDVQRGPRKNFEAALLDCERLIVARPRSALGHRMKSLVLGDLHDVGGSLAAADRAIELEPDNGFAYWTRALQLDAKGESGEAIEDLTRAIELRPDIARFKQNRAWIYNDVGEYDKALEDILQVVELNPDYAFNWQILFLTYFNRKEIDKLEAAFQDLDERVAGWRDTREQASASSYLSMFSWGTGNAENALAYADRAIALDPENVDASLERIQALRSLEGTRGIQKECDRLASLDLTDLQADLSRAGYLYDFCKRPEQAAQALEDLVERAPHWADPYDFRGTLSSIRGDKDRALADLSRAIEIAPAWIQPYVRRGWTFFDLHRHEEALADLEKALELEPDNAWVVKEHARMMGQMARFDEAIAGFERYFELAAKGADARWHHALVLLRVGKEEEALASMERAVADHPESEGSIMRLSELLRRMGRLDAALEAAARAVDRFPKGELSYLRRARTILNGAGTCRAALSDLATARELGPDSTLVGLEISWQHSSLVYRRCPREFDGDRALRLARTAVEEYPTDAYARLALGMALYRNGRHREAREAIRLAVDYRTPQPDPWDLFALAMVESKLGNAAEARNLYDRGVARLHETYPRFPDYLMMRDEAAEALGIQP